MAEYSTNALRDDSMDSSGLFEPDVMLPSQFNLPDESGLLGGERKLMAALLSDGIEAYIAQCTVSQTARRRTNIDAREWIETKDYSYVFSFDNVCECLGINADYLRLGLMRYVDTIHTQRSEGAKESSVWKKIRRPRKH